MNKFIIPIIAAVIISAGIGVFFIFQKPLFPEPIGKCGDGVCDAFERVNPNLCPKDCQQIQPPVTQPTPSEQPTTQPLAISEEDSPFGSNNPFLSDQTKTSERLKDLGVVWITDHLPRKQIEKQRKAGDITYNFSQIDDKIREYGQETLSHAWFVINVDSKLKHSDGKKEGKTYIPHGPQSMKAYGDYLLALIDYVNTKVPGWRVEYWSIDNEEHNMYIRAFCDSKKIDKECGREAAKAYVDVVSLSYKIIREKDPQAKVILGGAGGSTKDEEFDYFYKPVFEILKQSDPEGFFDGWDYHNFNNFDKYKVAPNDKGISFYRGLLEKAGFTNKELLVKAGGTHTGMDKRGIPRLRVYQTERQQAEHLIKRAVYHVANGVKLIFWGTIREKEDIKEGESVFNYIGLIYNGVPKTGECNPKEQLPCPDPGDGIKKLSYYTYKKMVEVLKGSDWNNIQTIQESNGVYVYKFTKNGKPVWVAWNDNTNPQIIVLDIGNSNSAKITETVPKYESGKEVTNYNTAFNAETKTVSDGKLTITLTGKPIFVESK